MTARASKPEAPLPATDLDATVEAARVMCRALGEASPATDRLNLAHRFGYHLVGAWWRALAVTAKCSLEVRPPLADLDTARLPKAAADLAQSLGTTIAALEPEAGAYQIGRAYTGMLPESYRGEHGIYYTPPALTARLLDLATEAGVDWSAARVLDPACGGGAFLAPVAKRMLAALEDCTPAIALRNIGARLRGYEIDPFGAWLSQVTLDAMLLDLTKATGKRLPVVVSMGDSLARFNARERFDLVVGNPPYGRIKLDADTRARYRRSLFGHANLYGLFTDLALRHVRQCGVIAYVTPTSFLAGEYFKQLRALLGASARPMSVDFVSARRGVFDDVLQETVLATYRRGASAPPIRISELVHQEDGSVAVSPVATGRLPGDPSQPWILARTASQGALVARLAGMSHRLADWGYTVSTGRLVWNRFKSQLVARPGRSRYPLIWAESIGAGGSFRFRADKKNHAPYFEVRHGDQWLLVDKPCVLLQRTTAKEQSRRLIAAPLPRAFLEEHGAVVIENHVNMVRPSQAEPVISAEVMAAFLNSGAADRAFRCVSGSVAVSAYELEALPLPSPEELQPLARLVAQNAPRLQIEDECDRLYGESLSA
jgi:adenine-specific DNA-methyltransferase